MLDVLLWRELPVLIAGSVPTSAQHHIIAVGAQTQLLMLDVALAHLKQLHKHIWFIG